MSRSRTITWSDPLESLGAGAGLSGLEYLQAIADGKIPRAPIAELMDFDGIEVEEGRVVFTVVPAEFHYNPIGVVHGGLALTLLDSVMGCAVHSTLPAGVAYTSLEVKVNFLRAMTSDTGLVVGEGTVIHRGRTTATAEGRVYARETGKLIAHGTTTCLILGGPGTP